ncbi:MAG: hypothetical protein HUU21_12175 [Polyangiaceae bacterium]|nr:hypothetical protein [Polyangiaceae bacterium]
MIRIALWGALALVCACDVATSDPPPPPPPPSTPIPRPTTNRPTQPDVTILPKRSLCPPNGLETGNPQSRFRTGGCVESFQYLFAENGATPPAELPSEVYAYHFAVTRDANKYVRVELSPAGADTCVKPAQGGEPIVPSLPLYEVFVTSAEGERLNLCAGETYDHMPGEDRRCSADELGRLNGKAFAIPGYWEWGSRKGEYREKDGERSVFTLACASGAAAKCMHWGYPPWAKHNGTPLKEHFLACVRAVRAQYRSDKDTAYTCRGAVIDIFDNLGIQVEDRSLPGFSFEASWNGGGLVSIRRPRYPACERKPEIQALLTGAQGTSGALISVRSARNTTPLEQCPDAPELCAPAVEKIE